ncbi:MAG: hypothetical protein AVDCRST_MAG49-4533, partial [uncultured Thermomicrobiales bacterium]
DRRGNDPAADPTRHHRHRVGRGKTPLASAEADAGAVPGCRLLEPVAAQRREVRRLQRHADGRLRGGLPRPAAARRRRRRADLAADPAQPAGDPGGARGRQARGLREAAGRRRRRGPRLRRAGGGASRPDGAGRRERVLPRRPAARPLAARRGRDRPPPPGQLAHRLPARPPRGPVLEHPLAARPRLRGGSAPRRRRPPHRPAPPALRRRRAGVGRDAGRQHDPRRAVGPHAQPALCRRRGRQLHRRLPRAGRAEGAERDAALRDRGGDDGQLGNGLRLPTGRDGRDAPRRAVRHGLLQRVPELRRGGGRGGAARRHRRPELPQHGDRPQRARVGPGGTGDGDRPVAGAAVRRGRPTLAPGRGGGPLRWAAHHGDAGDREGGV